MLTKFFKILLSFLLLLNCQSCSIETPENSSGPNSYKYAISFDQNNLGYLDSNIPSLILYNDKNVQVKNLLPSFDNFLILRENRIYTMNGNRIIINNENYLKKTITNNDDYMNSNFQKIDDNILFYNQEIGLGEMPKFCHSINCQSYKVNSQIFDLKTNVLKKLNDENTPLGVCYNNKSFFGLKYLSGNLFEKVFDKGKFKKVSPGNEILGIFKIDKNFSKEKIVNYIQLNSQTVEKIACSKSGIFFFESNFDNIQNNDIFLINYNYKNNTFKDTKILQNIKTKESFNFSGKIFDQATSIRDMLVLGNFVYLSLNNDILLKVNTNNGFAQNIENNSNITNNIYFSKLTRCGLASIRKDGKDYKLLRFDYNSKKTQEILTFPDLSKFLISKRISDFVINTRYVNFGCVI